MPKFSHQHYEVLAKVFNETRDKCGSDWAVIRSHLHEVLAKDNPKFSHTRFINACYSGTEWTSGELSVRAQQKIADHIDGYDRDDLGESPDY